MVEKEKVNLEDLIGTTIQISPQTLLNRGRLFTTQSWIDITKLANALKGIPDLISEPPGGWVSEEKQGLVYTVGDGNHRIALACIARAEVPFTVVDIWKGKKRYGFNRILNKVRNQLTGN